MSERTSLGARARPLAAWIAAAMTVGVAVACGGRPGGTAAAAPAPAAVPTPATPPAATTPVEQARLDFTLKDLEGRDVTLADFKGRPLLINFWATYCGPCKAEIPAFIALVDKYKSERFTVLGVSTDDRPDELTPFVAKYRINYPVLVGLGHDELMEAYDAQISIPRTWFIRKDGTVAQKLEVPLAAGVNVQDWFDTQVRALF